MLKHFQGECPCYKHEEKIVLSSTGGTANHLQSQYLGEYTYDSRKGYYVQSNSEINNELYQPRYIYLYRDSEKEFWIAGHEPGSSQGGLLNGHGIPSPTVPTNSNWQFWDGNIGEWVADPKLKVTKGALAPCPGVKIYGSGPVVEEWGSYLGISKASYLGIFKLTDRMWNGLPVYKNNNGELLHHGTDGSWKVGKPLTWHGIRGFPAGLCPSEATKWTYDADDKPADIIVKNL